MHHMTGGGVMMVWVLVEGLVGLAVLVLAVIGIVRLVRRDGTAGVSAVAPDQASDILRRRYAAGEIDDAEFTRRLGLLRQ